MENQINHPFTGKLCVLLEDGQSDNGLSIITKEDYIKHKDGHIIKQEGIYEDLAVIMANTPSHWELKDESL